MLAELKPGCMGVRVQDAIPSAISGIGHIFVSDIYIGHRISMYYICN